MVLFLLFGAEGTMVSHNDFNITGSSSSDDNLTKRRVDFPSNIF